MFIGIPITYWLPIPGRAFRKQNNQNNVGSYIYCCDKKEKESETV